MFNRLISVQSVYDATAIVKITYRRHEQIRVKIFEKHTLGVIRFMMWLRSHEMLKTYFKNNITTYIPVISKLDAKDFTWNENKNRWEENI